MNELRYFTADLETTVEEDTLQQKETYAWSAAICEIGTENVLVFNNIRYFFDYIKTFKFDSRIYFHNLGFDGIFILDYLLNVGYRFNHCKPRKLLNKEFTCIIDTNRRFYNIVIKNGNHICTFLDSYKLIPLKVEAVGPAYNTKHRKLNMNYIGHNVNEHISEKDLEYIKNDVIVMSEALHICLDNGMYNSTLPSCCMQLYKEHTPLDFKFLCPKYEKMEVPEFVLYNSPVNPVNNVFEYVMRSYKGGWSYLKKGCNKHYVEKGSVYDVNSLYPSVMHSKSGTYYPIGKPKFYTGQPGLLEKDKCYIIHLKTRFYLKKGKLPTIQIKNSFRYKATEWLETSDILDKEGNYHSIEKTADGKFIYIKAELYLTDIDYKLMCDHYDLKDTEYLDYCVFKGKLGLFDSYIDTCMANKEKATIEGNKGLRQVWKSYLVSLYGKFASNPDSSYLEPVLGAEQSVEFMCHEEHLKQTYNISIGSRITSAARNFTIRAAQRNYKNFIYADTDSLHILGTEIKGINIHPTHLLCWKKESVWSAAKYIRAKTYAEFIREEDGQKVQGHWEIKCAGMPTNCKKYFLKNYPITAFQYGLSLPGKLRPKIIRGGVLLVPTTFTLNKKHNFGY